MFKYNKEIPFFEMLVPTIDTVRFGYLLEKLLAVKHSVLYTGNTGVGKSVIAKGLLNNIADNANYVPIFINFSAQTSSNRTQEMIEGKLEKKRKNIMGQSYQYNCMTCPHNILKNEHEWIYVLYFLVYNRCPSR